MTGHFDEHIALSRTEMDGAGVAVITVANDLTLAGHGMVPFAHGGPGRFVSIFFEIRGDAFSASVGVIRRLGPIVRGAVLDRLLRHLHRHAFHGYLGRGFPQVSRRGWRLRPCAGLQQRQSSCQ